MPGRGPRVSGLGITGMTLVPKHPLAQPKRLSILFCPISRRQRTAREHDPVAPVRRLLADDGGRVPRAAASRRQREEPGPVSLIGTVDGASPVIHPSAWVAPGAVVVGRVTLGRAASIW